MSKRPPSTVRSLFNAAVALVTDWWRVDRIRASPRDGRLLRLAVPSVIRVGADMVEVKQRRVGQSAAGPYIIYECDGDGGASQLWVTPIGHLHRPVLRWVQHGRSRELSAEQVEVYV